MDQVTPAARRKFLRNAAGGLAAASAPALLIGCAATPEPKARVVVVGGGWGGTSVARALLAENAGLAVTLVEPNPRFMSCPLSAHYIAGYSPASDFQFGYESIDRLGVKRVAGTVVDIDRAGKAVVLADGSRIRYDFLVLSPGIEYMEEAIAGYAEARQVAPVGFRAFEQTAVKVQFDRFLAEGGEFVVTVPKPPYRCPPAPHERACLLAELVQKRKVKGKIFVLDANAQPVPPAIAPPIMEAYRERYRDVIEYVPLAEPKSIDVGKRQFQTSAGDFRFTAANVVLPMRAPELVRKAGLGERWANVKLPYFQSAADESIYVIGDAAGSPLPKSGHLAFESAPVAAGHIAARVRGAAPAAPTGPVALPSAICWGFVSRTEAFAINVNSQLEPGAPPKLQFKVDSRGNPASAKGADDWGHSLWKAMFG
jgi:NADPH-dependent 2,4-dienoyl-CoA reductase/sulfur reductase-like enzyme